MDKKRIGRSIVAVAALVGLAWGAAPAGASEGRADGGDDIYKALERDLGWDRDTTDKMGALQEQAMELDAGLQRRLGSAYAGAFFDAERGRLVVNSTTSAGVKLANGAGAEGRLVKHSLAELEKIKGSLDDAAGVVPANGAERRRTKGGDIGLSAWSVDPVTNSVLVSVTEKEAGAAKELLARYGEAVTIEEITAEPQIAANWMDGGDAINGSSCSAGFNLRNTSNGNQYLLTAGHCVNAGSTLRGQGNVNFGNVLESWFPSFDDAIARNTNTSYWIQGPWVDTNPSNGGIVTSSGFTDGLVGTTVCKSGITTKWTCGSITAKNQTVTYWAGAVSGLTRHNACVEPGDSGGANVSVSGATRRAEGVTSGASLIDWGGKKRCISAVFGWLGLDDTSWYFPIADSLAYYGPKYGVSTW